MGSSSSTRRRNDQVPPPRPFPPPIPNSSPSILILPPPLPLPPPPPPPLSPATPPPPRPPSSSHDANYLAPPPPPPPLPSHVFAANTPYAPPYAPNYSNYSHYSRFSGGYCVPYAASGQSSHPYYMNPRGGCPYPQPVPYSGPPPRPPPPLVDHTKATTIRNDVNLRKDTIRLAVDEQNPDHHLVTFTFDSTVDGSFTIFYMAKEGKECSFFPEDPEVYKPVKVPFQKGLGQKFCQPSGTGIDLGFFELDDLNKPSPDEVYPLVISAEARSLPSDKPRSQITLAVIEKKDDEQFEVKVIKQILWIDGFRYELREIYGIGSSSTSGFDDDAGKECVICMTERRNTAVMPCRHMCMCSECAEILRHQSNRCPICRNPVEQLMEIKV
ncbi:unnamed protein product [Victoria cruziana]